MDTKALVEAWRASLTDKERRLHELAAVKLKKKPIGSECNKDDGDNGSYYPELCHAFKAWQAKASSISSAPTK